MYRAITQLGGQGVESAHQHIITLAHWYIGTLAHSHIRTLIPLSSLIKSIPECKLHAQELVVGFLLYLVVIGFDINS
jgi:hypothetical protein